MLGGSGPDRRALYATAIPDSDVYVDGTVPLRPLSNTLSSSELARRTLASAADSVPMMEFCDRSSHVSCSKPVDALKLAHETDAPQHGGTAPDSEFRDSEMVSAVRSSRSCTGTVPFKFML